MKRIEYEVIIHPYTFEDIKARFAACWSAASREEPEINLFRRSYISLLLMLPGVCTFIGTEVDDET